MRIRACNPLSLLAGYLGFSARRRTLSVDELDIVDGVMTAGSWELGEVRNGMIKLPCSRCGRPNIRLAPPAGWPMEHINCYEHSFKGAPPSRFGDGTGQGG